LARRAGECADDRGEIDSAVGAHRDKRRRRQRAMRGIGDCPQNHERQPVARRRPRDEA